MTERAEQLLKQIREAGPDGLGAQELPREPWVLKAIQELAQEQLVVWTPPGKYVLR